MTKEEKLAEAEKEYWESLAKAGDIFARDIKLANRNYNVAEEKARATLDMVIAQLNKK